VVLQLIGFNGGFINPIAITLSLGCWHDLLASGARTWQQNHHESSHSMEDVPAMAMAFPFVEPEDFPAANWLIPGDPQSRATFCTRLLALSMPSATARALSLGGDVCWCSFRLVEDCYHGKSWLFTIYSVFVTYLSCGWEALSSMVVLSI